MSGEGRATVRQIYALAAVLCERTGESFPQSRSEASAMLDRLKGKPAASATTGDRGDATDQEVGAP